MSGLSPSESLLFSHHFAPILKKTKRQSTLHATHANFAIAVRTKVSLLKLAGGEIEHTERRHCKSTQRCVR